MDPYLLRNGTDSSVHITKRADQTVPEQFVPERAPKRLGLVSEQYGMSDTFIDVDRVIDS